MSKVISLTVRNDFLLYSIAIQERLDECLYCTDDTKVDTNAEMIMRILGKNPKVTETRWCFRVLADNIISDITYKL